MVRKRPLVARPISAGVFSTPQPPSVVTIIGGHMPHRVEVIHEKGGWIKMQWEVSPGKFEDKFATVTRERAVEAMHHLGVGRRIV